MCYLNLILKPGIGWLKFHRFYSCICQWKISLCHSSVLDADCWSNFDFLQFIFLNSASDLPSVRHEAVQAWLETVPGGSLVMFYVFQCTITLPLSSPCLQQLSWSFNPGTYGPVATAWVDVEGGRGVCMCALLRAPSRMSSTPIVTLCRQAKDSLAWVQECTRDPAERFQLLRKLKVGAGFLPPTLRLKERGAFLQLKG